MANNNKIDSLYEFLCSPFLEKAGLGGARGEEMTGREKEGEKVDYNKTHAVLYITHAHKGTLNTKNREAQDKKHYKILIRLLHQVMHTVLLSIFFLFQFYIRKYNT